MFIQNRIEIENPHKRRDEKEHLVISWLAEWRISSIDIVSAFIGVEFRNSRSFFRGLISRKIIRTFTASRHKGMTLIVLDIEGIRTLQDEKIRRELYRFQRYEDRGEYLTHDLQVQKYVLSKLALVAEVVSERSFPRTVKTKRPDAILVQPDLRSHAIEFEYSKKYENPIFYQFTAYLLLLQKNVYSSVIFVFPNDEVKEHYFALFSRSRWPIIKKDKAGKGNFVRLSNDREVPAKAEIRSRFEFDLLPSNAPFEIFEPSELHELKQIPTKPFLNRTTFD